MNEKYDSGYHHDRLAGEHPLNHTGQLISLLVFLVIWIVDSFIFKFSSGLSDVISVYARFTLGLALILGAVYILLSAERVLFKETGTQAFVVKKGVFSYVRHPLYLGVLMIYLGLLTFTLSIVSMFI